MFISHVFTPLAECVLLQPNSDVHVILSHVCIVAYTLHISPFSATNVTDKSPLQRRVSMPVMTSPSSAELIPISSTEYRALSTEMRTVKVLLLRLRRQLLDDIIDLSDVASEEEMSVSLTNLRRRLSLGMLTTADLFQVGFHLHGFL